jgi:DNA-directed RNA polymerase specialized sigma24 family protein
MTGLAAGRSVLMARSAAADLAVFESHRALLVALAYRMLGDLGRAEDMVQEAWLRWHGRREEADSPRAYLVTVAALPQRARLGEDS